RPGSVRRSTVARTMRKRKLEARSCGPVSRRQSESVRDASRSSAASTSSGAGTGDAQEGTNSLLEGGQVHRGVLAWPLRQPDGCAENGEPGCDVVHTTYEVTFAGDGNHRLR